MGRAEITAAHGSGRYTISIDFGESIRTAKVATMTAARVALDLKIAQAQVAVDTATAAASAAGGELLAAVTAYSVTNHADRSAEAAALAAFERALSANARAQSALQPLQTNLASMKLQRADLARAITSLQALVLTSVRGAWCADYTEEAAGAVATLEIPGESSLVLVAPSGSAPDADDGALQARELMSPEQAYFNAAILPGWQKFNPTFRRGTVLGLNLAADTATVELAAATSSAQALDVNQATTLTDIPVVYMSCNAEAFEVGDSVVVEFENQSWSSPRVIGFVTNPRACCEGTTTFIALDGVASTDPLLFPMPLASGPASEVVKCMRLSSTLTYHHYIVDPTFVIERLGLSEAFGVAQVLAAGQPGEFGPNVSPPIPGGGNVTSYVGGPAYEVLGGFVAVFSVYLFGEGVFYRAVTQLDNGGSLEYVSLPNELWSSIGVSASPDIFQGETITIDHVLAAGVFTKTVRLTFQDAGPTAYRSDYRIIRLISLEELGG